MREGKRESNCCRTPHSILKQHKNIPGVEMFVLKIQSCRGPFLPLIKVKRSTKYRWPPTCLRWTYPLPCWTLTEPPNRTTHATFQPYSGEKINVLLLYLWRRSTSLSSFIKIYFFSNVFLSQIHFLPLFFYLFHSLFSFSYAHFLCLIVSLSLILSSYPQSIPPSLLPSTLSSSLPPSLPSR